MYSVDITFELIEKRDDERAEDGIYSYLSACRMNGQVSSDDWGITFSDNVYCAHVSLPERNSLSRTYHNKYVLKDIKNMQKYGLKKPKIKIIGKEINSASTGKLESNDWFILFTNFLCLESPIRGGFDFKPIPLYRIPKTYDDEYYDIICWKSDYKYCDGLQMGCGTGERFGTREMSSLDSSLTQKGLEICDKLTPATKKPFYYYLYKGHGRSLKSEKERACPKCGNKKWKLEEPLFDIFDFKCDKCKLLSNIAFDVRWNKSDQEHG